MARLLKEEFNDKVTVYAAAKGIAREQMDRLLSSFNAASANKSYAPTTKDIALVQKTVADISDRVLKGAQEAGDSPNPLRKLDRMVSAAQERLSGLSDHMGMLGGVVDELASRAKAEGTDAMFQRYADATRDEWVLVGNALSQVQTMVGGLATTVQTMKDMRKATNEELRKNAAAAKKPGEPA